MTTSTDEFEPPKWHVDRSRVEAGRRCARLRWLGFHAEAEEDESTGLKVLGGYGRGLRTTAASLPLVTGTHTHSIFAALLEERARGGSEAAYEAAAARIIKEVSASYRAQTAPFLEVAGGLPDAAPAEAEDGLASAPDTSDQRTTVLEQAWLVECLGWVLALRVIPTLLDTWELVEAEGEASFDIDETIRFASRPDAVFRHRRNGRLAVVDLKTTSDGGSKIFSDQWHVTPQLNVACRAVSLKFGEECSEYYILALDKGYRRQDKDYGEDVGPKKQQTPLCYAFLRELPMQAKEWRATHYVPAVDADGEPIINPKTGRQRREGSTEKQGWRKVKVWEHASSAREYVASLPEAFVSTIARLIGPLECKEWLIDSYLTGIAAEEYRQWIPLAQEISAAAPEDRGDILDRLAPQSWDCTKYGRLCEFDEVCKRTPGGLDRFAPRVPHHAEEKAYFETVYGAGGIEEEVEE